MKKGLILIIELVFGLVFGGLIVYFGFDNKCNEKIVYSDNTLEEQSSVVEIEVGKFENIIEKLNYFDFYNRDFDSKSFDNQEMLYWAIMNTKSDGEYTYLDSMQKTVDSAFDYTLIPEDIKCLMESSDTKSILFKYDESKKRFYVNPEHAGHGGGGFTTDVINKYVSMSKKDDEYIVVVNKLFSNLDKDTGIGPDAYYPTYSDAVNFTNKLFDVEYSEEYDYMITNIDLEANKVSSNKLVSYTYVFERVDGNYYLVSYKIGK